MSDPLVPSDPGGLGPETRLTLSERYDVAARTEGILAPVLTALLAFFVGGLVVLLTTGKNPIDTYKAIFDGTGLNWLFPWVTGDERITAALNFQQTLLITTPLILTGLAVAFAFRCGMFNIGGQGQYIVGSIFAVWVGTSFDTLNPFVHVLLAIVVATLTGAAWAGIAGFLKATVGAHEVISTIMLNWVAIWVAQFCFGLGGPLQDEAQPEIPISADVVPGAKLPVFWGDPEFQGLSIGIFVAVAALVVYWVILNRTTLGYSVKAVGYNPEAARYGGISVARNYFLAMAISGLFAGLAGAIDTVGWAYRINTNDVMISSQIAFVGIAVALLGRNTAIGIGLSALLFASLVTGTSTRNLDPEIFRPELASNLTVVIQGLVVLFVGADVLILSLLGLRKRRRRRVEAATE
jgi:general nucleoside transport system permease protein